MSSSLRIIFVGIFFSIFMIYCYQVDITSEYENQSQIYSKALRRACESAVDISQISYDENMVFLYNTEEKRSNSINRFFKTLEYNFNYENNSSYAAELKLKVPVLCLIDSDGYYIAYNAPYKNEEGDTALKYTITPIYSWGYVENNKQYAVRFFLSDYVEVTNIVTGEMKKGTYEGVYKAYGETDILDFFKTKEDFEELRNYVIVTQINNSVEYFINNYNFSVNSIQKNKSVNSHEVTYSFDLPHISGMEWSNLIEEPSVIAFLQGAQVPNTNRYLNIYSMAGGELTKRKGYVISKEQDTLYYHRINCSYIEQRLDFGLNKTICAKKGAFPCPKCRP